MIDRKALEDAFMEDDDDDDIIDDAKLLNFNEEEGMSSSLHIPPELIEAQRTSGTRILPILKCWHERYL